MLLVSHLLPRHHWAGSRLVFSNVGEDTGFDWENKKICKKNEGYGAVVRFLKKGDTEITVELFGGFCAKSRRNVRLSFVNCPEICFLNLGGSGI